MMRAAPGRISSDAILLIALFVLLVLGGLFFIAPRPKEVSDVSTTYSADPKGVKAFYTLLGEHTGYRVGRLERPYTQMPKGVSALFVVQPSKSPIIDGSEAEALERWVSRGGTAIFLSDKLENVPESFQKPGPRGKGFVYAFDSRRLVTNEGVRDYRNALKALNALNARTRPGGIVLFDEYHHGIVESGPLFAGIGRQVWIALAILLAAGLALCYSVGRRFGAVRALPKSDTVRPGVELVNALGRLYKNAHATDIAAGILCEPLEQAVSLRPELKTPRVRAVLAKCRDAKAGQKLTDSELVSVAREIRCLEKELGIAGPA